MITIHDSAREHGAVSRLPRGRVRGLMGPRRGEREVGAFIELSCPSYVLATRSNETDSTAHAAHGIADRVVMVVRAITIMIRCHCGRTPSASRTRGVTPV